MNENYLSIVFVTLYLSFIVSCVIKLSIYKVKTIRLYLSTPIFPIIIVILNICLVIKYYQEMGGKTKICKLLDMLIIFFKITMVRLPLSIGLLCHSIKQYEVDKEMNYSIVKLYIKCLTRHILKTSKSDIYENQKGDDYVMDDQIKSAIALLEDNDYMVIKLTKNIKDDMDECARLGEQGVDKDCDGCSCNICILNH